MSQNLSNKAKMSVLWNTGFNLFRDALQFWVMLVLVRLLDPEAYGQFGMANSVIAFLSVFALQNFIGHTIQVRGKEDVNYQDHFTAGGFIQACMFILANLTAAIMRFFDDYAPVAPLVHVLSLTFLFEWSSLLRQKMLERDLDWKRLRLLHGAGLIFTSCLAILMGFAGAGVYALVVPGMFVTLPFIYDLFITKKWRPTWEWDKKRYAPALSFGFARLGSGLMSTVRSLVENGLMVQLFGYAAVGLLGRAVGLSNMFCTRLATQLMYAIYPVLTKVEAGTEKFRRMSALILQLVAWVAIPVAAIFGILAKPVVITVYGDKWLDVTPIIPWAMIVAALVAVVHTTYMLLLANHGQNSCVKIDIVVFALHVSILFWGLPFGLIFYLKCLVLLHTTSFVFYYTALYRLNGSSVKDLAMVLAPPLLGVAIAVIVSQLIVGIAIIENFQFWGALLYGALFIVFYLLFIRIIFERHLKNLIEYMPRKKNIYAILFL